MTPAVSARVRLRMGVRARRPRIAPELSCARAHPRRHRGRQSAGARGPRAGACRTAEHRARRRVRRPPLAARGNRGRSTGRGVDGHPDASVAKRRGDPASRRSCGRPTRTWEWWCSASTPSRPTRFPCSSRARTAAGTCSRSACTTAQQLLSALETVADGGSVVDSKIVDLLVASKAHAEHSSLAALTPREREVLAQMAQGKSNSAIAESLVLTQASRRKAHQLTSSPSWISPRRRTPASGSRPPLRSCRRSGKPSDARSTAP